MKDFLLKISLYTAIILLITNCATTKNSDTITNLKKTSFSENAAIYLAKNKSERNIFLKILTTKPTGLTVFTTK